MDESNAGGWVLIITALGVVLLQVVTLVLDYLREKNKVVREKEATAALHAIKAAADEQHVLTNSRFDEQRKLIADSSFAAGKLLGKEEAKTGLNKEDAPTKEEDET